MIFITWKSVNHDRNCECFDNMNQATKFIEENSLFEAMSNITFREAGRVTQYDSM